MHLQMINASFVLLFAAALILSTQKFVENRALPRVAAMHAPGVR